MSLTHFFYSSYWLTQPYIATGSVRIVYWIILLALVVFGIAAFIIRDRQIEKAKQMLYGRYGAFGITMGLTGLLLFFFRQQKVFFLGWRVWFLLWAVIGAVWIARLVIYHVRRLPVVSAINRERMNREQYLPKSK